MDEIENQSVSTAYPLTPCVTISLYKESFVGGSESLFTTYVAQYQ